MKKIKALLILAISLVAYISPAQVNHPIPDGYIKRIPRMELENGIWEKYRKGDYDNLWLGYGKAGSREGYVMARTRIEEHRHSLGEGRAVPVFVFHHHTLFDGCVIDRAMFDALLNIGPQEMVRVISPVIVIEYETEDFEEFKEAILPIRPSRTDNFFLWVYRTKKKKKEVIRIIDTADPEDFNKYYWEISYDEYLKLLGEEVKGKKR
ncbi:MAG: hypothetical protein LIO77_07270 [Rikenellaceae bacterium]|nr:hypothetical protein [Rikenellaceae bacterium]